MRQAPNPSMQRTGASRSAHFVFIAQRRLAPAADAARSVDTILHEVARPAFPPYPFAGAVGRVCVATALHPIGPP